MEGYRTEEEQIEHLKKWWQENGLSIVAAIVIGLSAVLGWRAWQEHLIKQAEAASDIYQSMINNSIQAKHSEARLEAERILEDYGSTTYAIYAAFMLARFEAENGNLDNAARHLQWIESNTGDEEFTALANLRHARILLLENKPEEALARLKTTDPGKYLSSYEELKGDIYVHQGNIDEARNAYEIALASRDSLKSDTSLLELKLDNLGRY